MKAFLAEIQFQHPAPYEEPTQIAIREFLASGLDPAPKDYHFNGLGLTATFPIRADNIVDARRDADRIALTLQPRLAKLLSKEVELRDVEVTLDPRGDFSLHRYTLTLADGQELGISAATYYIVGEEIVFLDTDCYLLASHWSGTELARFTGYKHISRDDSVT